MSKMKPLFDLSRARSTVEKGRRSSWWVRKGKSAGKIKYLDVNGKAVTNPSDLERINSLVIPPAWKNVRINPSAGGRLQAVGIDTAGRVQYLYHPTFAARQRRRKFAKIERFGTLLPRLRRISNRDISLDGLPREKVMAVVMRLINSLYFRVGTDLSAKHYKTYGITTLQKRHLKIGKNGELCFDFVGKSHIQHRKVMVDAEMADIIKELMSLGRGRKLFRYLDEQRKPKPVTPSQINTYLKAATGPEFSSKDFRTWGGTVLAAAEFAAIGVGENEAATKKNIVRVVKCVANELGNTPAVCRDSYIHPTVIDAYISGVTIDEFVPRKSRKIGRTAAYLEPEEKALLRLFESRPF